ncbi:similar to Saccharomyces cerevisiae YLR310C CDC25 Membrane bound guanine nucleotide exchange factor (GEF or GDP-release factor) [Maudiozyma saulgeensis]|uniref:Similar to Saccharomyces cerevisiae YLR310C CDC25 Membrane bound guanine nucleotide exchange factor (GEF or GDP-release factor) n=1 Tax=Maudiozyma saulgeensis TaxID=1789683 RepID=A0A1X7R3K0_9SACH|nr:similar to Saccharomyces cerevisiae YLR310C CDC25 Membrane bound guanine nucleotide exchange factor (GEF or GDP-release factor) [Kazachstania saulgeensis]
MEALNPTTPLFKYDQKGTETDNKRFTTTISPTKSLEIHNSIEQHDLTPMLPRNNITATSLATAIESFETAQSHRSYIQETQETDQHVFHKLLKGGPTSMTPQLNSKDFDNKSGYNPDDTTPKINNQFLDTIKQQNTHNISTENLGLGIITSGDSLKQNTKINNTNELVDTIRASITKRDTKLGSEIQRISEQREFTGEDTLNTLDYSDDDLDDETVNNKTHLDEISNYTYLFIIATHSFNVQDLENEEDAGICLSFQKDDYAFVHNVDESGWGEVTLISTQMRGWVPFNYFTDIIGTSIKSDDLKLRPKNITYWEDVIDSRLPLQKLLYSAAKFLINPKSHKTTYNNDTFNIEDINDIRDGVKSLLEMTEAVSRSDEIVQKSDPVRRGRKKLLADWYNLMIKADQHKNTTSEKDIANLVKLVYEVLRKAFNFYKVWSTDKTLVENNKLNEHSDTSGKTDNKQIQSVNMNYLPQPPYAIQRLNEIHDILFTYSSLILGRLDLIEHNPVGCETLELMVHQIIILLRELLYISKSCSQIMQQKYNNAYESIIDKHLDPLLALVSELVSCIKVLVTQTLQDDLYKTSQPKPKKYDNFTVKEGIYHYTSEGKHLIKIISTMTTSISNTLSGCNNYLRVIGNFRLGGERQYTDFNSIKITADEFVKRCLEGLANSIDEDKVKNKIMNNEETKKTNKYHSIIRFSSIRVGVNNDENTNSKNIGLTPEGSQFLNEILNPDHKEFSRDSTFDKFKLDDETWSHNDDNVNSNNILSSELLYDKTGNLIGASFRALLYKLTDELEKPSTLLMSTVLLNYRKFAKPIDLVNNLINRFDVEDKSSQFEYDSKNGNYSSRASRLKNRRRMVCKVISVWMDSFWDHYIDCVVLPTLINFFNEAVVNYLPIESKKLILSASKLFSKIQFSEPVNKITPSQIELNETYTDHWNTDESSTTMKQLLPRSMSRSKTTSIISTSSSSSNNTNSSFSLDERLIEEYGLTNVQNTEKNLLSLPLPVLNLGTSTLLTSENKHTIKSILDSYIPFKNGSPPLINHHGNNNTIGDLVTNWDGLETLTNISDIDNSKLDSIKFNITDMNPLEIAKQITLIESYLFNNIEQFELVNHKNLNLCPHIMLVMNFTNQLSNYVIESILEENISLSFRVSRLNVWLRIALSSLYFRNFNSLASIMTAVQSPSISRIKPIWNSLNNKDKKLFEYLARIVYPNHNYKVYREKLKQITDDAEALKPSLPTVPFFNIYLQDLTFVEDGNPNFRNPDSFRPNKLVNVDKYTRITNIINSVELLQIDYDNDFDTNGGYIASNDSVDKRDSFFNITDQLTIETNFITPATDLQNVILSELWRVNRPYKSNPSRGYDLSLKLIPRT